MRTPLYEEHLRLGAKMTEFAGWEMPLQYAGIAHEVSAVRSSAGLFDLCHMGEVIVSGRYALDLLQYLTTNDVSRLRIGQAQYTLLCDDNGGVIDDLIIYKTEPEQYLLIVNASNAQADLEWIRDHNRFGATVEDRSASTALIAVQGPSAKDLLQPLSDFDINTVPRFGIVRGDIGNVGCWVARTGYTGEDGFELLCSASDARSLWNMALAVGGPLGAEPIGLGARDVLRLEAAYPLHGHELSRSTNPVSARLMWVVKPAKGDFIGRDAILRAQEEGPKQVLVGLEAVDRCIPRHGSDVTAGGSRVGEVTSGTFSPTLGKGIAMAYVDTPRAETGVVLEVQMGGRSCSCRVVPTPFYKAKSAAMASAK